MSELPKKINNFAVSHLYKVESSKIKQADFSLNNLACHFNAVSAVNAGRADAVWLVWAGGEHGVIHFINSKEGVFFDETWAPDVNKDRSYRIIRKITPSEYDDVYDILCSTKKAYIAMFGSITDKIKNIHKVI